MRAAALPSCIAWVFGALLAAGCNTTSIRRVDMSPPEQAATPPPESVLLDVGVAIFDPNVPENYDEQIEENVAPEVRRAEGNYVAYYLKNLLQTTGQWGAVRVVPRPTHAVDLVVSGKILHSDGESLALEATVTDASDRVWFTRKYEGLASRYAYDANVPRDFDPFQAVYRNIADDMLAYRRTLQESDIGRIRTVAEMQFARDFAPDAFSGYVDKDRHGIEQIEKLPAVDDPMLKRVEKVREREYLFIDTLDEYFAEFHRNMYTPYQDWRRSTYDEAFALKQLKAEQHARTAAGVAALAAGAAAGYEGYQNGNSGEQIAGVSGIVAGAALLKSAISKRGEAKLHSEVLQELGQSAEGEISPHTIELENQTVQLSGTVDKQYDELRKILRRIYYEELGLAVPDEPTTTETPPAPAPAADS